MRQDDKRVEGFWKDNLLHGLGRIIESNYLFKGFYENGKRNGYGIEKFVNGNSYNGEF